jgi:stage IV sporulation protein B
LWLSGYRIPLLEEFQKENSGEATMAGTDSIQEKYVIPGGQSIGVKLDVEDVLIVGLEELETTDGKRVNPGLEAGLQIGDTVISIDGTEVHNAADVQNIIENTDRNTVNLKIGRKNELLNISINPVKTEDDGLYKLGLWVREETAGIGTLTFYSPQNGAFAALGHGITDPETGSVYKVADGQLMKARILSLKEGKKGSPGELRGIFYEADEPLGRLEINNSCGIFGIAYEKLTNDISSEPVEVADSDDVKEGSATILTTINGSNVQEFSIEIEKIVKSDDENKNMIISVTDKDLLEACGGIVQGMSGSPILQEGKLVGAVTHVLVNNPEKGYAIFAETMLAESNNLD